MKRAILLILAAGCALAQQGSLEGTAINAVTREPIANVHVRLIAATFGGVVGAYGAISDRAGHFSIATIRPGTYILLPERTGFLHVQAKGSTTIPNITIKPGEAVTGYQLEMTPRAVISGRVLDEAGDPVQGARVQTVPVTPGSTPVVLTPSPNPGTDDRGEFRLVGPAGKYYVQATSSSSGSNERPERRTDGTSEAVYATTFYPGSLKKEQATIVEAVAGKDVSGIEIRLMRQTSGGLSISGVVHGIPEGNWRGYVILQSGESAQRINGSRTATPGRDGKFRFEALQPGFYRAWASYNDGVKPQLTSRTMEWQLENSDISNADFELTPGIELSGTLKMEGDVAKAKRTVKLEPVTGYYMTVPNMSGGAVDSDGAFHITGIPPGKYRVTVEPVAENAYVKVLEIDGAAMTNATADLSKVSRSAAAKLIIGSNGAQISGRVLDANGERMQSNVVMIFLARTPEDIPPVGNGTAQATPDGKYSIKGIAPGKYHVFGLDVFQMSASTGDTMELFKKMFEHGEEIEFKEGDRITKDLKVTPMEDPNAKPKK